jgi:excisionase family DNA binding protein
MMEKVLERKLLTTRDVAGQLGVSPRTVFSSTRPRGRLVSVRIGKRVLYRQEDIDAFLTSCRQA